MLGVNTLVGENNAVGVGLDIGEIGLTGNNIVGVGVGEGNKVGVGFGVGDEVEVGPVSDVELRMLVIAGSKDIASSPLLIRGTQSNKIIPTNDKRTFQPNFFIMIWPSFVLQRTGERLSISSVSNQAVSINSVPTTVIEGVIKVTALPMESKRLPNAKKPARIQKM